MIVKDTNVPTMLEHGGTCRSWFFFHKEELRDETEGGYLEFIDEFELAAGAALEPHSHDTDEFYYLLSGNAVMRVGDEEQEVVPGNLIRIPRNEIHSIRAQEGEGFRALAFAISYMPKDKTGYTAYPPGGEPHFVPNGTDKLESES